MATDQELFKCDELDDTLAFLFLFKIAFQHYVLARVALKNGLVETGCLLAQQSVETFIKAIMRLVPRKERGHNLITLLEQGKKETLPFEEILKDDKKRCFLIQLEKAYLHMRYGEAKYTIATRSVIELLDELASVLRSTYLEKIKAPETKIYIPESLREDFFNDNKFFRISDVSNSPLASLGMPGIS
jgi:HEPN domain-containing protein